MTEPIACNHEFGDGQMEAEFKYVRRCNRCGLSKEIAVRKWSIPVAELEVPPPAQPQEEAGG